MVHSLASVRLLNLRQDAADLVHSADALPVLSSPPDPAAAASLPSRCAQSFRRPLSWFPPAPLRLRRCARNPRPREVRRKSILRIPSHHPAPALSLGACPWRGSPSPDSSPPAHGAP